MKINRRDLLIAGTGLAGGMLLPAGLKGKMLDAVTTNTAGIDRKSLVTRHNPTAKTLDLFSACTIGNGSFAFTADITGLQTFTADYEKEFPLCTCSVWAWHTIPPSPDLKPEEYKLKSYNAHGRPVEYATDTKSQPAIYDWLRENPHRLHLGRIGLLLKNADGSPATSKDISDINQTLDMWTGQLTSNFKFAGQAVSVKTCVHPDLDALAIRTESAGPIALRVEFPYGSPAIDMADWKSTDRHQTKVIAKKSDAQITRTLDQDEYHVQLAWNNGKLDHAAPHELILNATGSALECVICFSEKAHAGKLPAVEEIATAAADHWQKFWTSGGAVDLSQSTDPRAPELERRIVLSQYNTALHCTGPMPPQETGLLFNSWYGKSHLEMHWWHSVHFAAWNRFPLFESTLDYYHRIMPVGLATAKRQGYEGVRWPKMVGPDGRDSPSPIAPLLIWQQPHPIYYAQLCYRQNPTKETLEKWSDIVFLSASFMASYAFLEGDRYVLGPPLKTVPENADTNKTQNPTFELAYWRMGMRIALDWQQKLGLPLNAKWQDVLKRLSPLPTQDGLYLLQEGMTDTYTNWNYEHPSQIGALGVQPGDGVDKEIMRATLKKVMQVWDWDKCWGWDFPMVAMTAASLGEGEIAVKALMIESVKNRYLPNGHVYQRGNLTAYLPANGGLLSAIATMVYHPGGFPNDGKWIVRAEGISGLL